MDVDDELEEFPDVYELFRAYDQIYFGSSLGFASVEWSTGRMTMCAGVCCFNPGGETRIKLSEPLLKFRPVKDLKNTLLHEMIHAYMFLDGIRDRDSHGPKFQEKMHQINNSTAFDPYRPPSGYHITIYHTMIDEVQLYRVHHWRCEKCGDFIQRSMNRKPQPADCRGRRGKGDDCTDPYCHYHKHLRSCGGQYVKIAGPDLDGQKDGKGKKEKGDKTKRGQPEAGSKKVMTIEQAFGGSAAAKAGEDGQKRGVKLGRGDQAQDVAGSSPRKGQQQGAGKGKGHGSKSAAPPTPPTLPITSFFRTGGSIIQQGHVTGVAPEESAHEREVLQDHHHHQQQQQQQHEDREQHRQRCMEAALRRLDQSTGSSSKPSGSDSFSLQILQQQQQQQFMGQLSTARAPVGVGVQGELQSEAKGVQGTPAAKQKPSGAAEEEQLEWVPATGERPRVKGRACGSEDEEEDAALPAPLDLERASQQQQQQQQQQQLHLCVRQHLLCWVHNERQALGLSSQRVKVPH
uniref:SprT-like domain-containing protein n=1 Tax=Dunaliella tertiolecta TaxID=3047 RepID=A0A6S8ITU9_DUNTE